MSRRANAPAAASRTYKLRVDTLEDRVVYNAADPLAALAFVGPVQAGPDAGTDQQAQVAGHTPGCTCANCLELLTSGMGPAEHLGYAMPVGPDRAAGGPQETPAAAPFPFADTFKLHSNPTATKVVYLDFDGHTTTGTQWNLSYGTVVTPAFNFEGSAATFSNNERDRIQQIYQWAAEDFAPFDVDVTTEDPGVEALRKTGAGDAAYGIRVAIGGRYQDWLGSSAGGVAYLNSFTYNTDTPTFVFADTQFNDVKNIAEAVSHEVGHTFGLSHDTTSTQGYYDGHQGGSTPGWAPIMGVGYYQPVVQWSKGEYPDAQNKEDDTAIITNATNGVGYRADDAGNTVATAVAAKVTGTALSFKGVIEKASDVDVIKFATGAGKVSFTFTSGSRDADLDIFAELLDSAGTMIGSNNPVGSLNAAISNFTITTPGIYYLRVSGVGAGNLSTGYSDYGSLGNYAVAGSVVLSTAIKSLETAGLTFTEGDPPLTLTDTFDISTAGSIVGATVAVSPVGAGDTLQFADQNGIAGAYDAGTGVLTLTGAGSAADYVTALRSVTYYNPSGDPAPGARAVSFQVTDDVAAASNVLSRPLTVVAANDAPVLDDILGPTNTVTVNEDPAAADPALSVPLTGIGAGDGEAQALTVTATSDKPALIPNLPANLSVAYASPAATGAVTFKPLPNASGTATVTVTVTDANSATVTKTFTVVVNPVNDAPSFVVGPDIYALRDRTATPAEVSALGWATGMTVGPADGTESSQAVDQFLVTADDATLFAAQPTVTADGTLKFTPKTNAVGTTIVRVRIKDNGGIDFGGEDTSAEQTFVLNIGVNRAPTLDTAGFPRLNPTAKDSTIPEPTTVADFGKIGFQDDDLGTVKGGVAVVAADSAHGTWQFLEDDGVTWTNFPTAPAVSEAAALLLQPTAKVQFIPTTGYVGGSTLTYYAWDMFTDDPAPPATGSRADVTVRGAATPYSAGLPETATIRVAPLFTLASEDAVSAGNTLANVTAVTPAVVQITDADGAKAKKGLAVIGSGGALAGRWEFLAGKVWKPFGLIDATRATLLRDTDKIRFVPAAEQSGEAYLVYRAWDQSAGAAGTTVNLAAAPFAGNSPYSSGTDALFARVTPANDRPVLDAGGPAALTPINSGALPADGPAGDRVADLLNTTVTDADGTAPGLAVTGLGRTASGKWQYMPAAASAWSDILAASPTKAVLLHAADRLRFAPFAGVTAAAATISYKAWDGTSPADVVDTTKDKTAASAFSVATETATATVTAGAPPAPNAAPTLTAVTAVDLGSQAEDNVKPTPSAVSKLTDAKFTDAAGTPPGVAVVGTTGVAGAWQFSVNNGTTWKPFGDPSAAKALLLRATDKIRFVPAADANGAAGLTYRAWDQTSGSAGQYADLSLPGTAVGAEVGSASVTVAAVNDAPVLATTPAPSLPAITPGTLDPAWTVVEDLLGTALTDVDADPVTPLRGVAVTGAAGTHGKWQYQFAADSGAAKQDFTATASSLVYLKAGDKVRFVPNAAFTGTETLTYRGWDRTAGPTAVSKATAKATVIVNAVNDRPVLEKQSVVQLPSMTVGDTDSAGYKVDDFATFAITDPDGDPTGIAVVGADNSNGVWEFSTDAGASWFQYGTPSPASAVVLRAGDYVRFVPNLGNGAKPAFAGATSLTYVAWDGSDNSPAGNPEPTAGVDAFSLLSQTAVLAVNTAPVLSWQA